MIAVAQPAEPAASPPQTADERVEELQQMVSASRLSLYLSCRLKFFFRYVLRLQKPKSPALHVGSSVHAVLKAWNKARWRDQPLTLKELHDEFTKAWADTEEPVQWEDDDEAEQQSTAWKLIEIYTRQANPTVKPEAVEVPIEAELNEHGLPKLIGILDLVQGCRIIGEAVPLGPAVALYINDGAGIVGKNDFGGVGSEERSEDSEKADDDFHVSR